MPALLLHNARVFNNIVTAHAGNEVNPGQERRNPRGNVSALALYLSLTKVLAPVSITLSPQASFDGSNWFIIESATWPLTILAADIPKKTYREIEIPAGATSYRLYLEATGTTANDTITASAWLGRAV